MKNLEAINSKLEGTIREVDLCSFAKEDASFCQLSQVASSYGEFTKDGIDELGAEIEKPDTRKNIEKITIVGLHKRTLPKKSYLFILLVTWDDESHVTLYRKYKEIREFQFRILEELSSNEEHSEAIFFLSKLRRKTILRGITSLQGTMRRLRMIDVVNVYFQALTYYFKNVNDFEIMKKFFTPASEDLSVLNWCKNGKTYFYVTKSLMSNRDVTIENREITKHHEENNKDVIATLNRPTPTKLPLVARRGSIQNSFDVTSPHDVDIYVTVEAHIPRDVDLRHNIVDLRMGERVEVLAKSETGWWFVKRLERRGELLYGYTPSTFLKRDEKFVFPPVRHASTSSVVSSASCGHSVNLANRYSGRATEMKINHLSKFNMIHSNPARRYTGDFPIRSPLAGETQNSYPRCDYISTKDYVSENSDEISFDEGCIIRVIEKRPDGWWLARYKGEEGLVPGVFLKKYNDPIRKLSLDVLNLNSTRF